MLFADYALLGLGGAVSCFAALRWERERVRRSLVLSFIGGAVCGLAWCLDAGIRLGSGACLLFLVSYMAVLLRHGAEQEKSLVDILAAVSLACGCFGMLRVVSGALLGISYLSPFFRTMLALMSVLGVCAGLAYLSREFPEEGWQQYFCKEGRRMGTGRGGVRCSLQPLACACRSPSWENALCPRQPSPFSPSSEACGFSAWWWQPAGRGSPCARRNSTGMTCRPT